MIGDKVGDWRSFVRDAPTQGWLADLDPPGRDAVRVPGVPRAMVKGDQRAARLDPVPQARGERGKAGPGAEGEDPDRGCDGARRS